MTNNTTHSKAILARQNNGQFQLTITIAKDQISSQYQKALEKAAQNVEIPGFRKGKAPINQVESKIDQSKIYEQVLQQVFPPAYIEALKEHQLNPIIDPHIELLTVNATDDWQIRATAAELAEIKLPDYHKQLKGLLKNASIWTPDKDNQSDNQEKQTEEETQNTQKQKLIEWLLQNIETQPADILVEQQANNQLSQLLDQIQKLGVTLDQYLAALNKKPEDLRAEYAQKAKEEIKLELILSAIGKTENIKVTEEEINQLISTVPDPNMKTNLETPQQKAQLASIIFRQKTFEKLLSIARD